MDARRTLLIFGLCGLAGVLVDIDHIAWTILLYFKSTLPFTGRFLHIPIGVAAGCAVCGLSAYIGGLYIKHLLMEKQTNEQDSTN